MSTAPHIFEWPRPAPPPTGAQLALNAMGEGIRQVARDLGAALLPPLQAAVRHLTEWNTRLVERHNTEPHVAGVCARYYLRAALDPAYATPTALTELVATLMGRRELEDWSLAGMSTEHRAEVAASAVRGWAESYGAEVEPTWSHRSWASTTLTVVTR